VSANVQLLGAVFAEDDELAGVAAIFATAFLAAGRVFGDDG
jgi:hypothetical protein